LQDHGEDFLAIVLVQQVATHAPSPNRLAAARFTIEYGGGPGVASRTVVPARQRFNGGKTGMRETAKAVDL
jgi:hypothetical protein